MERQKHTANNGPGMAQKIDSMIKKKKQTVKIKKKL
jgi:hypothetical protein